MIAEQPRRGSLLWVLTAMAALANACSPRPAGATATGAPGAAAPSSGWSAWARPAAGAQGQLLQGRVGQEGNSKQEKTAFIDKVFDWPAGELLVALAGLGIVAIAIYLVHRGVARPS